MSLSEKIAEPADQVMCECSGTTRGMIAALFERGLDLDAISRRTGALSGCAGCEWDISEFLKELAATSLVSKQAQA